ncbi:MAG: hypothetical protein MZW92_02485 [Comamonadaceae bacterium]|nr:hypothetical protein [Comamonadaceae bacterium]
MMTTGVGVEGAEIELQRVQVESGEDPLGGEGEGDGEDQTGDGGAEPDEGGLEPFGLEDPLALNRAIKEDDEGGEDDADGRHEPAENAGGFDSDEGGDVHGEGTGRRFADGDEVDRGFRR